MKISLLRQAFLVLLGLATASTASAGTITTWTGTGSNNNWSQNGNWSLKPTVSGTTFSLVYQGNVTRTTSQNDLGGVVKVDSILFNNNNSSGQTSTYILSRSSTASLSLANGGTVTTTAAVTGTLGDAISSPIAMLGVGNFNIGSNHNLSVSGSLTGGGSIVKTGGGTLTLTGANALTALTIDQGAVQVNQTAFTGISGLTVDVGSAGNAGVIRFNGVGVPGVGRTSASFNIRMGGNANVTANANSNLEFTASEFNVANAGITSPTTLTLAGGGAGSSGSQQISGVIQDNSGSGIVNLTITGGNVWQLDGVNSYTGSTTINAGGRLMLNGSIDAASTTTSNGGGIYGTGTFNGDVISSGTIAPGGVSLSGTISDSVGALTLRSLTLSGNSAVTELTITGSDAGMYDQILGSSALTYAGTLALTLSDLTTVYDDNTVFNLFSSFTSTSGTLGGITLAAFGTDYDGLTFSSADANGDWLSTWNTNNQALRFSQANGTLTVVPEPSTIVFAGIGMAMFGWSTWTRRRANARRQAIEAAIA